MAAIIPCDISEQHIDVICGIVKQWRQKAF